MFMVLSFCVEESQLQTNACSLLQAEITESLSTLFAGLVGKWQKVLLQSRSALTGAVKSIDSFIVQSNIGAISRRDYTQIAQC
jgi:hypothetical protein